MNKKTIKHINLIVLFSEWILEMGDLFSIQIISTANLILNIQTDV